MKPTKFPALNKSDIVKLIDEVGQSIQAIAQTEAKKLAKADLPPPPEGSEGSSSSSGSSSGSPSAGSEGSLDGGSEGSMGGDPGAGAPAGPPPGAMGASPSAPPAGDPSASAGPPPGGPSGAPGPGGEQAPAGPSFEELVSLYSSLPPEDLEAHAAAMQQALQMKQGGQPGAPGAPPGAPPAGPPSAGPSAPPMMGKQEVATATSTGPVIGLDGGGGKGGGTVATHNPNIGPTKKSEVEEMGAALAKAQKDLEALGHVIETILTVPQRKAVTTVGGIQFVPMRKSETAPAASNKKPFEDLTKAELHVALTEATRPTNTKLSKSERDVVSEYYQNPGNVKLDALAAIYAKL